MGTVTVKHSLSLTGSTREPTKTRASVRTASLILPIGDATDSYVPGATEASVSVLTQLHRVVPLDPEAPLFPSLTCPGQAMRRSEYRSRWAATVKAAKVRYRSVHAARDTCASVLLSRGCPLLQVSAQIGDSIPTLAKHYAKFLPTQNATPAQPLLQFRALAAVDTLPVRAHANSGLMAAGAMATRS